MSLISSLVQWLNRTFNSSSYSTIANLFGSAGTSNLYGYSDGNPLSMSTEAKGFSDKYGGTNYLSQEAATTAFERQKELQDRDFAFQQQMWQQTNQYNSPEAQMQRFRDAGLNPNLVTGNAPVPAQPMSGSSASAPMATGANGAGDLMQFLKNLTTLPAQVDLMKAEAANLRASAHKSSVDADDVEATRQARIEQIWSAVSRNKSEVDDIISKIHQRLHQNKLTDAQRENISFEQMYMSNSLSIDWSRLRNETELTSAQIDKLKADTQKALAEANVTDRQFQEMVWTFAIRKAGLEKQNNLSDAKVAEAYATANKLGLDSDRVQQVIKLDKPQEYLATAGDTGCIIAYSLSNAVKAVLGKL